MTRSNTLKKLVSIGAAMLLAVGGSLVAAEPAHATTPLLNAKNMGYRMVWLPGESIESTYAAGGIGFSSTLLMDDITAYRGQTLTVNALNTGLPAGKTLIDNVYVRFYTSVANRTANIQISGTQIYNSGPANMTQLVIPANATAINIGYSTRWNGGVTDPLPAGTYSSSPRVFFNGAEIAVSTASSGSTFYTSSSNATVEMATSSFTTPSTGTVHSTKFQLLGCIDPTLLTAGTTYTASLKVNGTAVASGVTYTVSEFSGYSGNSSDVNGATGSFGSGSLNTLRANNTPMQVIAYDSTDTANNAANTLYDAILEFRDQTNTSLLKDCSPTAPAGTGSFSWAAPTMPGMGGTLTFTPDSTLGTSANWDITVFKASDDSILTVGMGQNSSSTTVNAPRSGGMQMGPSTWSAGETIYARTVKSKNLLGISFSSAPGIASANFTIPGSVSNNLVTLPGTPRTSSPTVVSEAAKPLPVWAAPILKAIPTLSKTLDTSGGKLSLTDGDFSSLKSVTIGGKEVAFTADAKGDISIPVPAGKGGTTADLIVTFTGGKMTIQDGIKYVEPVNVAAVREAPIAGFKGKSTKITGALAEAIQYAAQLDKKATTVLCTGYAASKAAVATVTAQTNAACAYATKVNDLLVNKSVKVVVNAKLAKTTTVGIKVHK